jgi:hypothetical protein
VLLFTLDAAHLGESSMHFLNQAFPFVALPFGLFLTPHAILFLYSDSRRSLSADHSHIVFHLQTTKQDSRAPFLLVLRI